MRPLSGPRSLVMTADAVGGVWRYAIDACGSLAARGLTATIVGLGPPPSAPQQAEAEAAGIGLHWLEHDLDWMAGQQSLQSAGAAVGRVARLLRPDVLHLNGPILMPYVEAGARRVAAAHSCLATWWQAVKGGPPPAEWRWHREATRAGLRAADTVIAPSRSFADALLSTYGPLPDLRVIHNATAPIAPAPKEDFVLAAGRWWDEGKNLAVLDAAAAGLAWPVRAAGPLAGPASRAVAPQVVEAIGDLPNAALRDRLARASVFASLSLYEPFGLAVLEAATAEAALVLADIPTFRELWDGCALFVQPRDPTDVAAALRELIADAPLRAQLGRRAADRARGFNLARQAEGLFAAYAEPSVRTVAV